MHFRNAASLAVLACASNVAAEPKPYRLAMMPVLGMSLMRRDTDGYQPEQSVCGDGADCAQACGAGFETCASSDSSIHCYNPAAKQNCCADGTGNSCDDGFYCTHDHDFKTWCCPDSLDLKACAAAFSVKGGLESATPTTTSHTSTTSTSTPPHTTSTSTKETPTPTPTPTSTPSTPTPTEKTTATSPDSTLQPPTETAPAGGPTTTKPATPTNTNAAGSNSVSALVLMAVGLFALF